MINRVIIVGRLVVNPELKQGNNSGNSFCSFRIAVDDGTKYPDGSKDSSFFTCTAFQSSAEYLAKRCRQGDVICVEGRLIERKFTRKDQSKGSTVEIMCTNVQKLREKGMKFRDGDPDGDSEPMDPINDEIPSQVGESKNTDNLELADDGLPF